MYKTQHRRQLTFTATYYMSTLGSIKKMKAYFPGQTLDDVIYGAVQEIRASGQLINPSKGEAHEITGVLLEIVNPRARLSRTETRGKIFSALGELCWYLAKSNDLDFIQYYIRNYKESADGDRIFGGYGPRLFDWNGLDQVQNVLGILRRKPHSRQAVIQLFDRNDITETHADIPCTCTLQFMNREQKLQLLVNMRSNDVHWGLPHDVFCFTMLQEIIARSLGIELGVYKHTVGSLHLYTKHSKAAKQFLNEGLQPTKPVMPAMPAGDPWPSIKSLLSAEATIRSGGAFGETELQGIDPYWADLIRLLQVFHARAGWDVSTMKAVSERMSSTVYWPLINRAIRQAEVTQSREPLTG